jgi:hypothetical protein
MLTLRTTVSPHETKYVLLRGTALAAGGIALLWVFYFFVPEAWMIWTGWLAWLLAGLFIGAGLVPYRRLKRLSDNPNLLLLENDSLRYICRGNERLHLKLTDIQAIESYRQGLHFGVTITTNGTRYKLPYFSERSVAQLKHILNGEDN